MADRRGETGDPNFPHDRTRQSAYVPTHGSHGYFHGLPPGPVFAPPPPPDDHFMSRWWKQIVGICLGLAAIGTVVYVIGQRFFVTRDEWVENGRMMLNLQRDVLDLRRTSDGNAKKLEEINGSIETVRETVIRLEEQSQRSTRRRTGSSTR